MNESHRLKEIRQTLNIKQGEFAKRISTTQGHISDIENGRKNLSGRTIKIISSEFNVNEEWLKTGKGDMFCSSPHENEFYEIFNNLNDITQEYLIDIAKGLLKTQNKLLNQQKKR